MDFLELFKKGGPIMWPLLAASVVALSVVTERAFFIWGELRKRDSQAVEKMLFQVKLGELSSALEIGKKSKDVVARVLTYGLEHDEETLSDALLHAANQELSRHERGLPVLDTIITLSPLLGLLGTVTGLIQAFGLLGNQELGSPTAITGGIAEALIATAYGLSIAILALIPFNGLNARFEKTKYRLEQAATRLELMTRRSRRYEASELLR